MKRLIFILCTRPIALSYLIYASYVSHLYSMLMIVMRTYISFSNVNLEANIRLEYEAFLKLGHNLLSKP